MASQDDLPSPPFFSIPNISNLRDAAIPLHTPHGPLRPGLLFRSAEVSKLDLAGWQAVRSLGVAHVFDLRSKPEVEKGWAGIVARTEGDGSGDGSEDVRPGWIQAMESAGVQRTWVPVFAEKDYSPEKLAQRYVKYMDESVAGFVAAYRDILRNGGPAYRTIFLYLAGLSPPAEHDDENAKLGALIHCTAGKDRTGVFFGILFDFLGVDRARIAAEYNLTERGLAGVREDVVARLLQSPGFQKYMVSVAAGTRLSGEQMAKLVENRDVPGAGAGDGSAVDFPPHVREEGRKAALRMVGARAESMLATLEMVDSEFGGSERYMREVCGLTDGDLERLRRVLVVGK